MKHFTRLTDREARLLFKLITNLDQTEPNDEFDDIVPLSEEEVQKIEAEYQHVEVSAEIDKRSEWFFWLYRQLFVALAKFSDNVSK